MTKTNKVIENWYTSPGGDAFTAPELAGIVIYGELGNHPIRTSRVERSVGRIIYTRSGSEYYLGEVHPDFLAKMKANNYPFDPENPIRVVDRLTRLD